MNPIETDDLFLAAFLHLHGQQVKMKKGENRVTFLYPDTPEIQHLCQEFEGDERLQNFLTAYRAVRTLLMAFKRPRFLNRKDFTNGYPNRS
jgi:hypothetical protein